VSGHPILQREAKALAEGCRKVGSPQIRNMGTLVGNVVTAQPAADGAIPLMALEAELGVASSQGERWVPLEDAYRGIGCSAIDATREIVTRVRFQRPGTHSGTGFFRMARRKALALPILNGAVSIKLSSSGKRVEKARIALGPVAERPFRSREAEARLESGDLSHEVLLAASRTASEEANPRTSDRGGAAYRKEMVRVQLFRLLEKVLKEAREKR
jgi:carbon-monoxide dehydrogenase medium subunit